ncbi:hypothetical protein [Terrimonas pollutisoli]|uniref:hypothetical protein n=1 Tax=Terrimonas pollutisoli TaxID=3034147 RepID=UPI0023ECAAEA|nr:hypothetical protein [Terrimonas sp. H1YJ31]
MLKLLRPMILVFILLSGFFIAGKLWLEKKGIDQEVLILGNLVLFAVSILTFWLTWRSLKSDNTHVFVRALYTGFIVKFFAIALAAFIYILLAEKNLNKPALFCMMGLYIVYSAIEVNTLLRILKQKKNA